jgi:prophage DNA circulation protein
MAKREPRAPARAHGELTHVSHISLPGVSDDEAFVAQAGKSVITFLRELAGFFTTAQALESEALAKLDAAKSWQAPKTSDDDLFIQEQIKDANTIRKQILEHWKITSLVSQFHKRLTGRRDKGADAAEEIATIGNRLHNGWTVEQKEKVRRQEESERLQRELDAQAARDRELQAMELKALAAEEGSPDLSERESRFVDLVFGDLNSPTTAARHVGFKDPALQAERLMKSPKIQAAIEARRTAQAIRKQREARAAAPLVVEAITPMKPDIQRAAGASERTTYSLEVVDEAAFIEAAFSGRYGIPHDLFTVKPAKGNEYARSMRELVNRWPGCRLVTKTGVI